MVYNYMWQMHVFQSARMMSMAVPCFSTTPAAYESLAPTAEGIDKTSIMRSFRTHEVQQWPLVT